MKNYTWEYIQKYPKQTKRLLGIDYQQLEQLMALGKLIHRKNQSEIEKTKIRINQPGSGTPPKLSEEEQIVLMLVYLRHHLSFQILGTCALIMYHLAGLVLLQSDFLAGILFLRKSLRTNVSSE